MLARARALFAAVFAVLFVSFLVVATERAAGATEPLDPKAVPEPLKPWIPWVLYGQTDTACPVLGGAAPACAFPTRLALTLGDRGGTFTQEWRVDATRSVPLPGAERRWPLDVKVDGKRAVVVLQGGRPTVELASGTHRIEGSFAWDSLPESLTVPPETGLLTLSVRGKPVLAPTRDAQGVVWLQKTEAAAEGDALEVVVHRRLEDDVPMRIVTRIQLVIAGKNREILLGRALPAGFVPLKLQAQIPTKVEPDGHLRIQARAGSYVIELTARSEGAVTSLERPQPDGPWREGDEVWVFQARPELRVVEPTGALAIDPQQTTLPDEWKKLPAYPMKLGTKLSFVEKRRGDADPPPDQLGLSRRMWLDFDGAGMTVSDHLTGTLSRSTRLEMQKPASLGRVAIRGKDQFITQLGDPSRVGVEIRQGELDVVADSRVPGETGDVPAVGWNHDFAHVSATLFVPPGYRVFHASGVDEVPGTWVRHWRLLEIFLVLILALATARLFGVGWGIVALVTLVLTLPEADAPKWIWAVILAFEALVRVLPEGRVRKLFAVVRFGVAMVLVLLAIPFLVEHVREGIYPALARAGAITSRDDVEGGIGLMEKESAQDERVPAAPPPVAAGSAANAVAPTEAPADKPAENKPEPKSEVSKRRADWSQSSGGYAGKGGLGARQESQLNVDVYDPNAMVQTGPGLPSWTWTSLDLRWSGPVERGQALHLFTVGPRGNLALALLRAVLLVLMLARVMPFFDRLRTWGRGGGAGGARTAAGIAGVALFAAMALLPSVARADVPSKELLDELGKRLVAPPSCAPSCESSSRLALDVSPRSLRARLAIDVAAKLALPLPGSASQWLPERVEIDGKPATGLLLRDDKLYVALDPGSHDLVLEGALPERETVQILLPLKPHRVEADLRGWKLDGLHEDGLADDSLQLTRIATASPTSGGAPAMETSALPSFVTVERVLRIGLSWQVETRVVRASPLGAAIVAEVPLLPGESVTTADVRVVDRKVLVNLGAQATETSWRSVLETKSPIRLTAPKGLPWVEVWRLDLSPVWHASFEGIPPVHPGPKRFATMPEWRPWPGESASLAIAKPEGIGGQTLTVDDSRLEVRPGLRSTDASLTLKARSSRGGQHVVTLPEGAILESLKIGGVAQPIRQEGRDVAVPVTPGAQEIRLGWREPRGQSASFTVSPIDLHLPTVNALVEVTMSNARWVLFAYGPRLGPAVLFWSLLLVLVVVAVLLSRISFVPVRVTAWLLLAIGLSQIPIVAAAVVVAWLVALGARKRWPDASPAWFDLRQIALAMLTLAALVVLLVAVHQGLLGQPDMQIEGNGSSSTDLRWFADRTASLLPQPTVVSVPILVYRLAMLGWALWLALAVLSWLRFGWTAFSTGGLWLALPTAPRPARWQGVQAGPPAWPTPPGAPTDQAAPPAPAAPTPTNEGGRGDGEGGGAPPTGA